MTKENCPVQERWQDFLIGRVEAGNLAALEEHLLGCQSCLETLSDLQKDDSLVDAIRRPVQKPDAAQVAMLDNLARQFQECGQPSRQVPSSSITQTNALGEADTSLGMDDVRALISFLHPAQGTDELGRLGGYRVLKILGAGGMGVVFLAEDPHLKRQVALKAMKPILAANAGAEKRFEREAQAAAAINHDNVITIHQVGIDQGIPFLAMEFLEGETLDQRLRRQGMLTVPVVLRIGQQIAAGLAAAHERGLIHRDVKPANVWLQAGNDRVKLVDFGLVRATGKDVQITREGAIVGTPAFMAPEQAQGNNVDSRADLFSLGCVLYRMATGVLPFEGSDPVSILYAIGTAAPVAPRELNREIPVGLSDLIMQMLAKDPVQRPASAQVVADRLAEIERHPHKSPKKNGNGRHWGWLTVATVALLVPLSWLFGGTVIRFATNKGELIIVVDDPDVVVSIHKGQLLLHDKTEMRQLVIEAGNGELRVFEKDGKGPVVTKEFKLNRGGKATVTVTLAELADARQLKKVAQAKVAKSDTGEIGKVFQKSNPSLLDALRREAILPEALERLKQGSSTKVPDEVVGIWRVDSKSGATSRSPECFFTADGKYLVTATLGILQRWDLSKPGSSLTLVSPESGLGSIAGTPSGDKVALVAASTGKRGLRFQVFDVQNAKLLKESGAGQIGLKSPVLAISPDGAMVAAVNYKKDEMVSIWNTTENKWNHGAIQGPAAHQHLLFTPDSKSLIVSGMRGDGSKGSTSFVVDVCDLKSGKSRTLNFQLPRGVPPGTVTFRGAKRFLALSPNGDNVLVAGYDPQIAVFDMVSAKNLGWRNADTKNAETETITSVAYNAKGDRLASLQPQTGGGFLVRIWEMPDTRMSKEIRVPAGKAGDSSAALAWHPDGRHLAMVTETGTVLILRISETK